MLMIEIIIVGLIRFSQKFPENECRLRQAIVMENSKDKWAQEMRINL